MSIMRWWGHQPCLDARARTPSSTCPSDRVVAITGAIVRAASVPGFGDRSVLAEVYRP
jgi:hypothetical protein